MVNNNQTAEELQEEYTYRSYGALSEYKRLFDCTSSTDHDQLLYILENIKQEYYKYICLRDLFNDFIRHYQLHKMGEL
jgi:hypothetical protein